MRHPGFQTLTYNFINYAEMGDKDSKMIWELRNRPLVAKWMVNSAFIPYADHIKFINQLITNSDKDYYLVKDYFSNIIGSVNIDYTTVPYPERGIFINPKFFHQNHAYNSMQEFYRYIRTMWNVDGILTKVKIDNYASNRLEDKLGAELFETKKGYNIYHLSFGKEKSCIEG